MTATIIPFPTRSAEIIPITAAAPPHTVCTHAHKLMLDTLRVFFAAARSGCASALVQLEIAAETHEVPQIARLAQTLAENVRNPPPAVLVTGGMGS